MNEKQFNLLDEPWIKVVTNDLSEQEVSLKTLFANAHLYRALSGETATQNAAILRFLLAIVITVLYRYDEDGEAVPIDEDDDVEYVIERWQAIWKNGKYASDVFDAYLEKWRDRFWLFHPERPFLQLSTLTNKTATTYSSNMLISDMKTSGNKKTKHHFGLREGNALLSCSFAQAARGLIFLNAYSVNVKKPSKKECGGNPSQVGRLGQLGLIYSIGDNLFETLMFNATLLKNGESVWPEPRPTWEREQVNEDRGVMIGAVDNLPELYTIPRRKMLLKRDENRVTGINVAGGEYYEDRAFNEQMTIWQERKDNKTKEVQVTPKRHQPEVSMWREFSAIFGTNISDDNKVREPGLISWIKTLLNNNAISTPDPLFRIRSIGMTYDGMKYAYVEEVDDGISLSYQLLNRNGEIWRASIIEEIDKCEQVGNYIKNFGKDLSEFIYGDRGSKAIWPILYRDFYVAIDKPFRQWLMDIHPEVDSRENKMKAWEKTVYRAAKQTVENYIENADMPLFVVKGKNNTVPKMLNRFYGQLNHIY